MVPRYSFFVVQFTLISLAEKDDDLSIEDSGDDEAPQKEKTRAEKGADDDSGDDEKPPSTYYIAMDMKRRPFEARMDVAFTDPSRYCFHAVAATSAKEAKVKAKVQHRGSDKGERCAYHSHLAQKHYYDDAKRLRRERREQLAKRTRYEPPETIKVGMPGTTYGSDCYPFTVTAVSQDRYEVRISGGETLTWRRFHNCYVPKGMTFQYHQSFRTGYYFGEAHYHLDPSF